MPMEPSNNTLFNFALFSLPLRCICRLILSINFQAKQDFVLKVTEDQTNKVLI